MNKYCKVAMVLTSSNPFSAALEGVELVDCSVECTCEYQARERQVVSFCKV